MDSGDLPRSRAGHFEHLARRVTICQATGKDPSAPDEGSDTGGKPVVRIECEATKEIPWGKEGRLSL